MDGSFGVEGSVTDGQSASAELRVDRIHLSE